MLKKDSPMPFGPFQGQKMSEVPAQYLLWLRKIHGVNLSSELRDYIRENLPVFSSSKDFAKGDKVAVSLMSKPYTMFRKGNITDIWKQSESKSLYKVKYTLMPGEISPTETGWLDPDVVNKLIIEPD